MMDWLKLMINIKKHLWYLATFFRFYMLKEVKQPMETLLAQLPSKNTALYITVFLDIICL